MTTTISRPVQVFALLGVIAAVGFAGFTFLASPGDATTTAEPVVPAGQPTTPAAPAPTPAPRTARRPGATQTRSGFPVPVDRALRRKRLVVVAVYVPGANVDLVVRAEARAAAATAGAAFVAISATNERHVRTLVGKTGVLPEPAVLVVRRPDVVAVTLGVTDRATIAQAVAQARR